MKYWEECIAEAADECGIKMTDEQIKFMARAAKLAHDSFSMAHYTPPSSDRIRDMERQCEEKCNRIQAESERYRKSAETAIKKALHQSSDAHVFIDNDGDVYRSDGRTTQIQ